MLPLIRYHDVEAAIRRANGTEFGLDASVWGSDSAAAKASPSRLEAGTVWVNRYAEIAPHVPFEEGLAASNTIRIVNGPGRRALRRGPVLDEARLHAGTPCTPAPVIRPSATQRSKMASTAAANSGSLM